MINVALRFCLEQSLMGAPIKKFHVNSCVALFFKCADVAYNWLMWKYYFDQFLTFCLVLTHFFIYFFWFNSRFYSSDKTIVFFILMSYKWLVRSWNFFRNSSSLRISASSKNCDFQMVKWISFFNGVIIQFVIKLLDGAVWWSR